MQATDSTSSLTGTRPGISLINPTASRGENRLNSMSAAPLDLHPGEFGRTPPANHSLAALANWPLGVGAVVDDFALGRQTNLPGSKPGALPSLQSLSRDADRMLAAISPYGRILNAQLFEDLCVKSQRSLDALADEVPENWTGYVKGAAAEIGARQAWGDSSNTCRPPLDQTDFFLHSGPLATWSSKSTIRPHSVIAATRNSAWAEFYERVDRRLPDLATRVSDALGEDLAWRSQPTVIFPANIVVCGGEANTVPKNIAYFFPEDSGHSTGEASTILFSDFYVHRFLGISVPLLKAFVPEFNQPQAAVMSSALHLWFRGHDAGHFLSPQAAPQRREVLSHRMYGVLDEVWADVVGYFVACAPQWEALTGVSSSVARVTFLAELLRYVRRGSRWFADSAAASVELAALETSGALDYDASTLRLSWSEALMDSAMIDLGRSVARLLFRDVRSEDVARLDTLNSGGSVFCGFLTTSISRGHIDLPYDYRYC